MRYDLGMQDSNRVIYMPKALTDIAFWATMAGIVLFTAYALHYVLTTENHTVVVQVKAEPSKAISPKPNIEAASVSPASDNRAFYPSINIINVCRTKWKTDYRMVDHCANSQRGARDAALEMRIDTDVSKFCSSKWPNDWTMFHDCAEQQMLHKTAVEDRSRFPTVKIDAQCEREWPNNYRMEKDCRENEYEAESNARWFSVDDDIRRNCAASWQHTWRMYHDCLQQEKKAKRSL